MVFATGVFIGVCAASYLAVNIWHIEANEGGHSTAGHIVNTCSVVGMIVLWVTCFALYKIAPSLPVEHLSAAWVFGTFVCLISFSLSYPDYPCPHMFVQLSMVALSLRSRFGYSIVGLSALGHVVAAYNEAAHLPIGSADSLLVATVPHPLRHTTFWQRFRRHAT